MIRVEYDLGVYSYTLKFILEDKRIDITRPGKFRPLQSKRDWYINKKKRVINWNKHTMGTE